MCEACSRVYKKGVETRPVPGASVLTKAERVDGVDTMAAQSVEGALHVEHGLRDVGRKDSPDVCFNLLFSPRRMLGRHHLNHLSSPSGSRTARASLRAAQKRRNAPCDFRATPMSRFSAWNRASLMSGPHSRSFEKSRHRPHWPGELKALLNRDNRPSPLCLVMLAAVPREAAQFQELYGQVAALLAIWNSSDTGSDSAQERTIVNVTIKRLSRRFGQLRSFKHTSGKIQHTAPMSRLLIVLNSPPPTARYPRCVSRPAHGAFHHSRWGVWPRHQEQIFLPAAVPSVQLHSCSQSPGPCLPTYFLRDSPSGFPAPLRGSWSSCTSVQNCLYFKRPRIRTPRLA